MQGNSVGYSWPSLLQGSDARRESTCDKETNKLQIWQSIQLTSWRSEMKEFINIIGTTSTYISIKLYDSW